MDKKFSVFSVQCSVAIALICAIVLLARMLVAEEPTAHVPTRQTIEIGQALADMEAALRDHQIESAEGRLELFIRNDDETYRTFQLEKNRATAVVFYSKSKKKLTGISLLFSTNRGKAYDVWLSAKSITLEADGSYSVHFLAPAKEKEKQPPPENHVP